MVKANSIELVSSGYNMDHVSCIEWMHDHVDTTWIMFRVSCGYVIMWINMDPVSCMKWIHDQVDITYGSCNGTRIIKNQENTWLRG